MSVPNITLVDRLKQFLKPAPAPWHTRFLEDIARALQPRNYLEVGVYHGVTFKRVAAYANFSVGIDVDENAIRSITGIKNSMAFLGSLQDYCASAAGSKFDLIFIDADHSCDAVISDFSSAVELSSQNCVIVLDDTFPGTAFYSQPGYCGDAFKAVALLRDRFPDWSFVTIPVHPGLTVCARKSVLPDWVFETNF